MRDQEARDLLDMITAAVRVPPMEGRPAIFWTERMARLDVTIATKAVLAGSVVWRRFPSWAEFHEFYAAEQKAHDPERFYQAPVVDPSAVPPWIKRYVAARYFHKRFNREQDMRTFPEQSEGLRRLGGIPASAELMPEEEWVEEAKSLTDAEVRRAFSEPEVVRGEVDIVQVLKETAPRPRGDA